MNKIAKRALKHSGRKAVTRAIADVVRLWKEVGASARELEAFSQTMANITEDLGLTPGELRILAAKGTDAAKQLPRLLEALQISMQKIAERDPLVVRDLQRVCTSCEHKRRCDRDISAGTLAENYENYCPNVFTLKALKRDPNFTA